MERDRWSDTSPGGSVRPRRMPAVPIVLVLVVALLLSACAPGTDAYNDTQAGFFSGIWHGWIAPLSIILHIFDDRFRVYEVNNTGIWYDVGFYMAIISGFGSLGIRRRRKDDD